MKKILLILLLNTPLIMQANGKVYIINNDSRGVDVYFMIVDKNHHVPLNYHYKTQTTDNSQSFDIPDKAYSLSVDNKAGVFPVVAKIDSNLSYTATKDTNVAWKIEPK